MRSLHLCLLVAAEAALVASAASCGKGGSHASGGPGGAGVGGSDAGMGGDGLVIDFDSGHGAVIALSIVPPSSTITVTNPMMPPTQALTAEATYADKTMAPISASWTLDRLDIASVGAGNGVVTPTGTTFAGVWRRAHRVSGNAPLSWPSHATV